MTITAIDSTTNIPGPVLQSGGALHVMMVPNSDPQPNAIITGGSIDNTPIGQTTPAAGAFTTLNATSAGILGPMLAEGVSSSANAQAPGPTNSGITWGSSPTWAMQSFYDQSLSANNRSADLLFITGSIKFRFANDARNAFLDVFSITGGQASGVTGITSTSGTGDWAHTGNLTVTNYVGSLDTGALPGFSGSSGAFLYAGNGFESLMLQRIGNTAGNRRAYVGFSGAGVAFGFFNDQAGTQTPVITAAGGAASGITGVTSSSGTGAWAHTGTFSASGAINSSIGLTVKEGSNAKQGIATLAAGTVTVANTSVTANSRIFLTGQDNNVTGALRVSARTAGTSFVITSSVAGDTGVVAYEIFEPGI